jgi:putative DNA primase/helicase
MVQPLVMAKLLGAGAGVARGTGALARFLVCWPESTMGGRAYRPGDVDGPELRAFDARLTELLGSPLPVADGDAALALAPPKLRLAPAAFELWRAFHDDVERELAARGEYAELRDFAAKAAEQAARLACVLHVFEHGPGGAVGAGSMEAGAKLAAWHLHEARRMLGLVGRSGEAADAAALLEWLGEQPGPPTAGDVLRLGPHRVRDKARRDRALAKLAEHQLARGERDGKATRVVLNPALGGRP